MYNFVKEPPVLVKSLYIKGKSKDQSFTFKFSALDFICFMA